jgi:hypothetical protein
MKYEEARHLIQSGDLVFFGTDKTLLGRFISWWSGSHYTHAAIAVRMSPIGCSADRVLIIEEHTGGQRIINLSAGLVGRRSTIIIAAPVDWSLYGDKLLDSTGAVEYAYAALIQIGLREKFGLKLKDIKGEVCSEMVAQVLKFHGIAIPTTQVSPGFLLELLTTLGFKQRVEITLD